MKPNMKVILSIFMCFTILFSMLAVMDVQAAQTITSDQTGTQNGYFYSFWNAGGGSVTMTLGDGGNYSVNWSNCNNFTCGKGWNPGSARDVTYSGSFNGGSNGYLALYGWTKNKLVEFYVVENYGSWTPPGGQSNGTLTSDGATYTTYKMYRSNAPSIIGTASFDQYWSVRSSKRSSGTITFSNHINAWKGRGMDLGSTWDYLIMETEGYQSSGSSNITVGGNPSPSPSPSTQPSTQPSVQPSGTVTDLPLRQLTEKMRAKGHEFYVGVALSSDLGGSDQNMVKTEFDIVTADNAMKIGAISPNRGQYNYSGGDNLINFARQGNMKVHGHCFVWHKYNPSWVDGTKSMMQSYISTVAGYYKGKIYAWDVVNEAFQKDGTYRINAIGSNGQDGASIYGQRQGKQYIEDAFVAAHQADPSAKLIYNEYDMETRPAKFDGVYAMIKDFKSRNIPIDGVGFQMHLGPSFTETDANRFADEMQKFADLGVESYVTEMDVGCSDTSQSGLEKQAQIYGWIAKACAEQPYCRGLQMWGIRDSQSWRINPESPEDRAIAPLIFNDNGQKKPAYYAIQKALSDAVNSSNATPTPTQTPKPTSTNTPQPTPTISIKGDFNNDGVINMKDVMLLATAFNSTSGSSNYNVKYDLNNDGAINMSDVYVIIQNYNKFVY